MKIIDISECKNQKDSRKKNRKDLVYIKIKELIYYNKLVPGQKLIYKDLSQRLGVSITPIVQALSRLENSGLVRYVANQGYFVRENTESDLKNLYAAREALELYIVSDIVENITKQNVELLRIKYKQSKEEDKRKITLNDANFHLEIDSYSRNDVIIGYLIDIYERIYLRYRADEYLSEKRIREMIREHRVILGLLEEKNIEALKEINERHIKDGLKYMISNLKKEAFGLEIEEPIDLIGVNIDHNK